MFELLSQKTFSEWFTLISSISAASVMLLQSLEYLTTKNLPWIARLMQKAWRWLRRFFLKRQGGLTLIVNCSGHPVHPAQKSAIETLMHWQDAEVLDVPLGNVPEDEHFIPAIEKAIDRLDLTPQEWQQTPLVVIPAGYPSVCSLTQAILHGRLGHFPNTVRLRRIDPSEGMGFEVAEIMPLQQLRHESRGKR